MHTLVCFVAIQSTLAPFLAVVKTQEKVERVLFQFAEGDRYYEQKAGRTGNGWPPCVCMDRLAMMPENLNDTIMVTYLRRIIPILSPNRVIAQHTQQQHVTSNQRHIDSYFGR